MQHHADGHAPKMAHMFYSLWDYRRLNICHIVQFGGFIFIHLLCNPPNNNRFMENSCKVHKFMVVYRRTQENNADTRAARQSGRAAADKLSEWPQRRGTVQVTITTSKAEFSRGTQYIRLYTNAAKSQAARGLPIIQAACYPFKGKKMESGTHNYWI